ncbi:MAG: hypothetical protein RI942_689, partial [Pseudomonadota bacterium]
MFAASQRGFRVTDPRAAFGSEVLTRLRWQAQGYVASLLAGARK